ncbi:MAG: Stp1/IreP family PP2C-type Ser/Thr phosphatase [Acutalibacteraceae bacterium]
MKIVAKTDKGKVRKDNQDSYAAGELPGGVAWAVVCDGMGGAAGGNVASSIAVKMISEKIAASYQHGMSDNSIRNMLISVIETANASIYEMSCTVESLNGMGTTVVAVIIRDSTLYIAHAGDSRAYRISENSMRQLTRDHSVVQDMVEHGELTEEQAREHPGKNIITRALGVSEDIDVDFSQETLDEKDVIIICTDGLTNYVETDDIYNATRDEHYYEFADRLVNLANENGGGDNITVVAMAF